MSNETSFFSGRYWLPAALISVLLCLSLSAFFGYQWWQNTNNDNQSIQKLRELHIFSRSVLSASKQGVVGDEVAIDSLRATIQKMDGHINTLLANDVFKQKFLEGKYESVNNFWHRIKNNASTIVAAKSAVVLVRSTAQQLESYATNAQVITVDTVDEALLRGASKEQVSALSAQSLLLRKMSDAMQVFSRSPSPASQPFDVYQQNLVAFERNYRHLLEGDVEGKLQPLRSEDIKANVGRIYRLLDPIRDSDGELVGLVEALLLARGAQEKMAASFERLQFVLTDMLSAVEAQKTVRFPQPIIVLTFLVALLMSLIILFLSLRQASQQVDEVKLSETENVQAAILRLLDELADLADGDLTVTTTVSEDFTGAIADSVNYTIDQLRQLVSKINNTAVQVSGAAQESQQTALHLAEASDHQAQEIAGASAAINEMAVTIDQVSANAAESALVASKSVSIANNGAKLVQNTIHGMDTIREQIQDTSKRIKRLGESSQEIGDIVSLINDIADQTNILALNAAIQASMAGDAGRGFAVVADEVQRLAERSAAATKQIESLVKTIQTDTNEAVISMEQTTTEVVGGARLAQAAGVALEEIEGVSVNIAELIQNISNAARQQASSAGHISNTMNVIQEITSQTSAGTGATAQAIGDLANMALELRESVAGFTLPEDMEVQETEQGIDIDEAAWSSAGELEDRELLGGYETESDIIGFKNDLLKPDEGFTLSDALFNSTEGSGVDSGSDSELPELFDDDGFELAATQTHPVRNTSSTVQPTKRRMRTSSFIADELDFSMNEEFEFVGDNADIVVDEHTLLDEMSEVSTLGDDDFGLSSFDLTDEELDAVR